MNETDRLLTARDLADFLEIPLKTLYAWRCRGEGPIGFRVGKHVRYRWVDVERWIGDRVELAEKTRQSDHFHSQITIAKTR